MLIRLHATLARFEGRKAVLRLEDGQELTLSREDAAGEVGEEYVLQAMPAAEAALGQEEFARTLLNQILQNETHPQREEGPKDGA
jgi:hypothetical protein